MSSSVRAVAEEALSPHWADQGKGAAERAPESWLGLVGQLSELQDAVAGSVPPPEVAAEVSALLARSRQLLEPCAVSDEHRVFGRLHNGDRLCAEATALFVDLRPGQP